MVEELIMGRADLWLGVEKKNTSAGIEVTFHLKSNANYVLHWGLARRRPGPWQAPPEAVWPADTRSFSKEAVQTPFSGHDVGRQLVIRLDAKLKTPFLASGLNGGHPDPSGVLPALSLSTTMRSKRLSMSGNN